jgi:Mg/Co/Ni transporter MgtE
MDESERLLDAANSTANGTADNRDRTLLEEAHPADVAAVLRQLSLADQVAVFRSLSQERAGEILPELDDHALLELVRALDDVEVSRVLSEMPPEEAADVVEELSTEQAEKILDLMQEEKSEEIQEILEYPEHSAGRLMSPDFVAVNERATVEQAIDHVEEVGLRGARLRAVRGRRSRAPGRCRAVAATPHGQCRQPRRSPCATRTW